jgi:diaminopimelate epimerase
VNDALARLEGREFWKMTGSGNDFVFFDARLGDSEGLELPEVIQAICHRSKGIGADGIVLLKAGEPPASVFIRYYNSDGSIASLCGNATLCATRLTAMLNAAPAGGFAIGTDAGLVKARLTGQDPEIDLQPIQGLEPAFRTELEAGERRIGFAEAGVPHLVVLVDDVDSVRLQERGSHLRRLPELAAGANVNFVSGAPGRWWMRTYERGVEGETLACGTGAVATGSLLRAWGLESGDVRITTRSGRDQVVTIREQSGSWLPSLSGEGRVVYSGRIGSLG